MMKKNPGKTMNTKMRRAQGHWHNSLIWGDSIHDIAIIGHGLINGKNLYKEQECRIINKAPIRQLVWCVAGNVIIKDISILHGGWFGILATGVDNFTLDNVKFDNPIALMALILIKLS